MYENHCFFYIIFVSVQKISIACVLVRSGVNDVHDKWDQLCYMFCVTYHAYLIVMLMWFNVVV